MSHASETSADDLIVCSFHTDDAYYTAAGDRLRRSLDAIGVPHDIASISADGADWIDICRKKIPFLHRVCSQHPDKKVFWIDGDCALDHLPDFVRNSSADLIGFQRGFSSPLKIGYVNRSRFWEPCFWGIGTSAAARAYISTARDAEERLTVRATDDYFFEEAWRVHAEDLTFQVIPSGFVAGKSETLRPFFLFGSSGNVSEFKGEAAQHQSLEPRQKPTQAQKPSKSFAARVQRKLRREAGQFVRLVTGKPAAKPKVPKAPATAQQAIKQILAAAKGGNRTAVETISQDIQARSLLNRYQQNALIGAQSFLDYTEKPAGQVLPLVWWERPYPGNFGDWLSPLIFHRSTHDRKIQFVPPNGKATQPHLVGLGSIVRFANDHSIVAGAGVSQRETEINTLASYVSVRGPLTAEVLKKAGGPEVTSFGDPGVLMPRLMPLKRGPGNGRIALVRHYAHRKLFLRLPEMVDEHSIAMSDAATIAHFIQTLLDYDAVITSAMHVYIICQSYGIPCGLVTFASGEGMVHGDGTKYIDYARGAGVPEQAPIVLDLDLRARSLDNLINDYAVPESKMDEVETALNRAVGLYDDRQR